MIHAYDELYLEHAQTVLAYMLDFAVNDLNLELDAFYQMFLESGFAANFSKGDCRIVAGKSGVELAYDVLLAFGIDRTDDKPGFYEDRSREYWTGYALAYYQWWSGLGFDEINAFMPVTRIRDLYHPYHEMDLRQFADYMEKQYRESRMMTRLAAYRMRAGLSQKELAAYSEVPVRTIQQYEQRQKQINKAAVETLVKLSQVLCCEVEDLLERPAV